MKAHFEFKRAGKASREAKKSLSRLAGLITAADTEPKNLAPLSYLPLDILPRVSDWDGASISLSNWVALFPLVFLAREQEKYKVGSLVPNGYIHGRNKTRWRARRESIRCGILKRCEKPTKKFSPRSLFLQIGYICCCYSLASLELKMLSRS